MKHRWRMAKAPMGGPPIERCTRCGVNRADRSALRPGWVEDVVPDRNGRPVTILRDDCRPTEGKRKCC